MLTCLDGVNVAILETTTQGGAGWFDMGLLHFRSSVSGVQPNARGIRRRVRICLLWNKAVWNIFVGIYSEKTRCHLSDCFYASFYLLSKISKISNL